ncbi:hypothetical protein [Candidatus Seongchinamella marina]|nr:hypothetical protein [Candidatus Seongchinamella marina]
MLRLFHIMRRQHLAALERQPLNNSFRDINNWPPAFIGPASALLMLTTAGVPACVFAGSLCDVNDCKTTELWMNGASQDYLNYFTRINGYHVGTQEHQKYVDKKVKPVLGIGEAYIALSADEVDEFECIGNGYVNLDDRSEVYPGRCRYEAGALSTLKNGVFVNRTPFGGVINSGGIEIRLKMEKNDASISFDELFKRGAWPAIWLMSPAIDDTFRIDGASFEAKGLWPEAMELDILEFINGGWTANTPLIGSIHYGYLANETQTSWNYINNVGDYDRPLPAGLYPQAEPENWHNYGFTWNQVNTTDALHKTRTYTLNWYYDGKQYQSLSIARTEDYSSEESTTYSAERTVGGQPTEIWCTSSSARCCTLESARCNIDVERDLPKSEAEVMFQALELGMSQGYYLNMNFAAGGAGIGVYDPVIGGFPPPAFGSAEMQVSHVSRYTFGSARKGMGRPKSVPLMSKSIVALLIVWLGFIGLRHRSRARLK